MDTWPGPYIKCVKLLEAQNVDM